MRDLGTQLRAYVDEAVTDMPSPERQIDEVIAGSARAVRVDGRAGTAQGQGQHHRWWRSGPAVAVMASLAVLALGVMTVLVFPLRDAGPSSIPSTASGTVGEWIRVPDPIGAFAAQTFVERLSRPGGSTLTGTSEISVVALVDSPKGIVAVGREQIGLRSIAAVWTSNDSGFTWERVAHDSAVFGGVDDELGDVVPNGLSMTAVAYGQGRFVAVGTDTSVAVDAVAWYSDDGRSWTRVPVEDGPRPGIGFTGVSGVVAGGPGFVAVGVDSVLTGSSTTHSALVWTSQDGAVWQTSDDAIPGDAGTIIADAAVVDDSIVAVGSSVDPTAIAAWISQDGATWEVADVVDTTDANTPYADVRHVVATPSGAIAVGLASSSISGSPISGAIETDIAVWITKDGLTWSRVPTADVSDDRVKLPGPIVWGPTGLISLVSLRVEVLEFRESSSVMWTSSDGVIWEETPVSLIGRVNDLAVIEGRYVAVGSAPRVGVEYATPDDVTWDGAIWIAQSE